MRLYTRQEFAGDRNDANVREFGVAQKNGQFGTSCPWPFAQAALSAWKAAHPRHSRVVMEMDADDLANLEKFALDMMFTGLPAEVRAIVESWGTFSKSPYSASFYDSKDITWAHKPEGSLRLSDHWNFKMAPEKNPETGKWEMRKHCRLDTTDDYVSGTWILARYENGIYKELRRL